MVDRRKKLSEQDKQQIREGKERGLTCGQQAYRYHVSKQAIHRITKSVKHLPAKP
jgi:hypothetical protein